VAAVTACASAALIAGEHGRPSYKYISVFKTSFDKMEFN
jgi:hypothetical protein